MLACRRLARDVTGVNRVNDNRAMHMRTLGAHATQCSAAALTLDHWRITMKTNHLFLLSLAMSTALFATACNRDSTPDTTVDTAPAAMEPAPMEPAMPADPAPMAPAMGMSFAEMDKNSDGSIAMDELTSADMLHQKFSTADSDGDGKLSMAEVDKHNADMAANPGM